MGRRPFPGIPASYFYLLDPKPIIPDRWHYFTSTPAAG